LGSFKTSNRGEKLLEGGEPKKTPWRVAMVGNKGSSVKREKKKNFSTAQDCKWEMHQKT